MIWLTWRQFRVQAAAVLLLAAALALVLAISAPPLASLAERAGSGFLDQIRGNGSDRALYLAALAMYALPPVIGAFWGAPLIARELEAGTHRLAWSQSVTRRRWLVTKVGLTGLIAVAVSTLLSLAVTWWASPIDRAIDQGDGLAPFSLPRMSPVVFGTRGVVPIAYTAMAFVIGIAAGLVLRRTVPAMVVTLLVVVAVQFGMPLVVRAHVFSPRETTTLITSENLQGLVMEGDPGVSPGPVRELMVRFDRPDAWQLTNQPANRSGELLSVLPPWVSDCVPSDIGERAPGTREACFGRLASEGYHQVLRYQPGSRFWALQASESAILLAIAGLVLTFCFGWIRRVF